MDSEQPDPRLGWIPTPTAAWRVPAWTSRLAVAGCLGSMTQFLRNRLHNGCMHFSRFTAICIHRKLESDEESTQTGGGEGAAIFPAFWIEFTTPANRTRPDFGEHVTV